MRWHPPSDCAICGADIPPGARSCPECGADERTGWREQDPADGLDLPDDEDTAEAHARFLRELDEHQGTRAPRRLLIWGISAAIIIALLAAMFHWR